MTQRLSDRAGDAPTTTEPPRSPTGLDCLATLGRTHGLTLTADRLMVDNDLSTRDPDTATLALCAERAGLRSTALTLDWTHLGELKRALPAIVRLRDGRSLILTRIERSDAGVDVVLQDPLGESAAPIVLLRPAFEASWTGDILLVKKGLVVAAEEGAFGWGTIGLLLREQPGVLRDLVLTTAILALLALAPILFAQAFVGEAMDPQARGTFVFLLCGFGLAILFETAFAAVRDRLLTRLATRIGLRLEAFVFDRVLHLPSTTFETMPAGLMAHRMERVAAIGAMLAGPLPRALLDGCVLVVFFVAMLFISAILAGVVLVCAILAALVVLPLNRRYRQAGAAREAAEAEADVLLTRTLGGFGTVKSLALEGAYRRRWDVLTARVTRLRLAEADAGNILDLFGLTLERVVVLAPFALGVALAITGVQGFSRAALFAVVLLGWRMAAPLRDLPGLAGAWNEGRGALRTLAGLVDAAPETDRAHAGTTTPIRGHVAFQGVQFSYPEAPAPALQSLTFEAPAGTMLGIFGRSGAGKSTIARLLQRLHTDYQGLIKIDGIDVREFDLDHLRGRLLVVGPESVLFSGTIRENLLAARPAAPEEAVSHALRLVGAEGLVEALPKGLDTPLTEGAPTLSDGERQRLVIARALIADPAVLILDEASSALDPESEAILTSNLRRIAGGRTLIVISQRLAALMQADSILVLDRGEAQDIGRHQELIERSDLYSGLWRRQTSRLDRPPPADRRLSRSSHVA